MPIKCISGGTGGGGGNANSFDGLDAAFLLTIGGFLLAAELFAYSCVWELFAYNLSFLLTI